MNLNLKEYPGVFKNSNNSYSFKVWSPFSTDLCLNIDERKIILQKKGEYFSAENVKTKEGARYTYTVDGKGPFPDPVSFSQPDGVFKASEVLDISKLRKSKEYQVCEQQDLLFYELHTGVYTSSGTFKGLLKKLPHLKDLGITAIVLMPVNSFSGRRNWGYDGVFLYAVQNSYGTAMDLAFFIKSAHDCGIAVVLDVVYNHIGPEGNCLSNFAPYFTDSYHNHWGDALNFDGPYSRGVREFFFGNILLWLDYYNFDGLRLDAIHGIRDNSASPFLQELAELVRKLEKKNKRKYYIIAESDLNDVKVVLPLKEKGFGHDAQWNDDFHHALHTALTNERCGYYCDYHGLDSLIKVLNNKVYFAGEYSAFRKREHGNSFQEACSNQLVVYAQTHDQVGNRADGRRLSALISSDLLICSAAAYLLSPFLPQIFMGEEYGEENPFFYFIDHDDEKLKKAVDRGRKRELKEFGWEIVPPVCYKEEAFSLSKLKWKKLKGNQSILSIYKELIELRKSHSLSSPLWSIHAWKKDSLLIVEYNKTHTSLRLLINFSDKDVAWKVDYQKIIYSRGRFNEKYIPAFGIVFSEY